MPPHLGQEVGHGIPASVSATGTGVAITVATKATKTVTIAKELFISLKKRQLVPDVRENFIWLLNTNRRWGR